MKCLLVLQFTGSRIEDFDALVSLKDKLIEGLTPEGEVDGHDFGSDEGNFISTNDPHRAFRRAKELLDLSNPRRKALTDSKKVIDTRFFGHPN